MGIIYDDTDDTPTKIGKVIGSVLAILVFIGIVALLADHMLFRY